MAKNYNSNLQTNNTGLQAILNTINELPEAGGGDPVLQDKTVTPTTSKQTVTADSGYDGLDTVTVNAMPTATQATPAITINSSTGLITATATQTAGYVAAGTKSATHQLAFQAAQTITPGTTNKTIAANTYLGGVQTIKGDANLVASNIVSGKSIFGVVGTAATGDTSIEDGLLTKRLFTYTNSRISSIGSYAFYNFISLTSVSFPNVTSIGSYTFSGCYNLTSVSFPNVTRIDDGAFFRCSSLTSVNFPNVTSIGASAFFGCAGLTSVSLPKITSIPFCAFSKCSSLTSVNFPNVTSIDSYAFSGCSKLTAVSFPKVTSIGAYAFAYCTSLTSIYLLGSSICVLSNSQAFNGTKITSTTGSIFVKSSLVSKYQASTNWRYFSSRIFGM